MADIPQAAHIIFQTLNPVRREADSTKRIRVKEGDNLRKLAKEHLGDADRWNDIKRLNDLKTSKVEVGQRLVVPVSASKRLTLEVPMGDGSPTVIDGYGGWEVVSRPFRTGLTVWKGFSPIVMTVPLLFENFDEGTSLEDDIELLELMAGRGRNGGPLRPPPVLRLHSGSVYTTRDSGLIPANYRTLTDDSIVWVINDIEWDGSPIRNSVGNRIRQACTVTLMQFVGPEALDFPDARTAPARARVVGRVVGGPSYFPGGRTSR